MSTFKTIGIITKPDDLALVDTLRRLLAFLDRQAVQVLLDRTAAALLESRAVPELSLEDLARRCDLAIVIGGDGTLLHSARSLWEHEVPIVGINRGRLGFLVDISPEDMEPRLTEILSGRFNQDFRFLIRGSVLRGTEMFTDTVAFNDIVVQVRGQVRMIEFETAIDGRFLNRQRADGQIVATPTGSTAYALSGGGPILYPNLETLVIVPICPHTLSSRPIVVHSSREIEIRLCEDNTVPAMVSFDGQFSVRLRAGDRVRIQRAPKQLRLIQPEHHDYFEILRAKLRWSESP